MLTIGSQQAIIIYGKKGYWMLSRENIPFYFVQVFLSSANFEGGGEEDNMFFCNKLMWTSPIQTFDLVSTSMISLLRTKRYLIISTNFPEKSGVN